jgi:sugar phosphate isomerase/epimerase
MEPVHIHIPYPKLKDYFELLRKRRYDLEIYLSAAVLDQIEKPDLEKLLERLDWNPALTLHAPFMDMNPGAVDPMVRSVTQVRFRQLLNVAAILKPRAAVFHAAYDRWRYSGRKDIWLEYSLDTWHKVVESASKIGLRVAVENVFDEDPEALKMLIEKIGSPDFGFCFDTGHFNLFSTVSMEQWFENLGENLIEVHLHDNDGTTDSHWALGRGDIDFQQFFRLMRTHSPKPVYTIEAHDRDDVETSLDRVKALLQMQ